VKRLFFCLLGILLLAACARQPIHVPPEMAPRVDDVLPSSCLAVFPQGSWQLVHQLEFSSAERFSSRLIGVTILTADGLHCALVSVEGVTLFEARAVHAQTLEVLRAVPPFDRPAFGAGLLADLRLLFRSPAGTLQPGRQPDGRDVCRSHAGDGRVVDILPPVDGRWQIREYHLDRDRSVVVEAVADNRLGRSGIASSLVVQVRGEADYELEITLIEATVVP
jgi:hypothetical protein